MLGERGGPHPHGENNPSASPSEVPEEHPSHAATRPGETDRAGPVPRIPIQGVPIQGGWKRAARLSLAALFFGIGALGVILPGLPTTPFLLLTSYFLVRSSPRLNAALLRSRLFGPVLTDWQIHGGVRRDIKLKAIGVAALVVAATIVLSGRSFWPSLAISILALVGIAVVWRLPAPTPRPHGDRPHHPDA